VDLFNIAGLSHDNQKVNVTVYLADRFSNTNILEGHAISFYTEAGAIPTQGQADASGAATVVLRSQNPRPTDTHPLQVPNPIGNEILLYNDDPVPDGPVPPDGRYTLWEPNPRDGWVSILAVTKGEETFTDGNGNGLYDAGENFEDNGGEPYLDVNDNGMYDDKEAFDDLDGDGGWDPGEPFYDKGRGEPFYDADKDGARDATEPFTDLNGDFVYDASGDAFYDADQNGIFDAGEIFKDTNGTSGFQSGGFYDRVYNGGEFYVDTDQDSTWTHGNGVWDANIDIWTPTQRKTSSHKIAFTGDPLSDEATSHIEIESAYYAVGGRYAIPNGACATVTLFLGDVNNNAPIPGTTVSIKLDGGKLLGQENATLTNFLPRGPYTHTVSICDDDAATTKIRSSSLEVDVVWTPQGVAEAKETFFVFGTVE